MLREAPTTRQGVVMALIAPVLNDRVSVAGQF